MSDFFLSIGLAIYISLFLCYLNKMITNVSDDINNLQEDLANLQVQFSVYIDKKGE